MSAIADPAFRTLAGTIGIFVIVNGKTVTLRVSASPDEVYEIQHPQAYCPLG